MHRHIRSQNFVASAAALVACSGFAVAAQTGPSTLQVGQGYVQTWTENGTPMVAISLDGQGVDRVVEQRPTIRLRYAEFDPAVTTPAVPRELRATADSRAFIVQYVSQPLEAYGQAIADLGGQVERFLADQAQIVTIDPAQVDAVADLPFVRWVGEYHPAYKLHEPDLQRLILSGDSTVIQNYSILALNDDPETMAALQAHITAIGSEVTALVPEVGRLEATLTDGQLLSLAQRSEVLYMDFRGQPEDDADIAREIGGANYIEDELGFTGQGVRGEVMDSGLFTAHQEFADMDVLLHGPVDSQSHGTAVFSIVFAPGVRADARGFLPDAEQQIMADYGGPARSDRYTHTEELVDPSDIYRAVFQTNSWGDPRETTYTTISAEMDDILFDFDILITQSQSNSGSTPSRPQAWAKNIVSVGGIVHQGTLTRSDDCHCFGGSTGPAGDGRIKPDLAHFYDQTTAATTGGVTAYTQFGGTSGATPITAGHFGLFFQMWSEGVWNGGVPLPGASVFDNRPSATTAKAMMISSAFRYDPDTTDMTRFTQGWGMADLRKMYDERDRFFIVDQADVIQPLATNAYSVKVASGEPDLRVTMAYPDPQGTVSATIDRINDLTLKVTSPTGEVYWGNNGLATGNLSTPGGDPNTLDTVENVFIENPAGGVWTVEVIASEINEDGHPDTPGLDAVYSMVVAGVTPTIGLSLVSEVPGVLDPGAELGIAVEVVEGDETLVGTPTIFYDVEGAGFVSAAMTADGDQWIFDLPAAQCDFLPQFYVEALGSGGTQVSIPPLGAIEPFSVDRVGTFEVAASYDFEDAAGWDVADTSVAFGSWEAGVPVDGGRGDPSADFDGSGAAFVTGNLATEDLDGGPTVLTSPVIDLSNAPGDSEISYARWFFNDDGDDFLTIEVSDDGGSSWTLLESVTDDGGAVEWQQASFPITDFVELTSAFRIRFSVADNPNDSITEAAIDALSISGFRCDGDCLADFDGDGELSIFDFLAFQNAFDAGDLAADLDGDGSLSLFDFLEFQNLFDAGCP
ncbi:MAG: GC-type dockerin domain-anchored protein [Planctomycetota bacterium]